jgi:hypothetical protein
MSKVGGWEGRCGVGWAGGWEAPQARAPPFGPLPGTFQTAPRAPAVPPSSQINVSEAAETVGVTADTVKVAGALRLSRQCACTLASSLNQACPDSPAVPRPPSKPCPPPVSRAAPPQVGPNADWTSPFKALTPEQEAAVDAHVETTYKVMGPTGPALPLADGRPAFNLHLQTLVPSHPALRHPRLPPHTTLVPERRPRPQDFLSCVAEGRRMSVDAVRQLAKGRVYTGRQAMEVRGRRAGASAATAGRDRRGSTRAASLDPRPPKILPPPPP